MAAPDFNILAASFKQIARRAPRVVGGMAVTHFKGNFQRQGWTVGGTVNKWVERKSVSRSDRRKKQRAILIRTGKLRRSVRIIEVGPMAVRVGSNVKYAQIHNEGGRVKATQNVPEHTRKAFRRKIKGQRKLQNVSESKVKAHTRKVNFKMPKRKFIGPSLDVMKSAQTWLKNEIDKAVKEWK